MSKRRAHKCLIAMKPSITTRRVMKRNWIAIRTGCLAKMFSIRGKIASEELDERALRRFRPLAEMIIAGARVQHEREEKEFIIPPA